MTPILRDLYSYRFVQSAVRAPQDDGDFASGITETSVRTHMAEADVNGTRAGALTP